MTERDVVLRERAAVDRALEWVFAEARRNYGINGGIEGVDARRYIEVNHPLPTVTRPRVVRDENGYAWAFFEGKLNHASDPGGNFVESECVCPTPERIKLWADLLANPNETVGA